MLVKCRECGKLNEKEITQHVVVCDECDETTAYWIFPGATVTPQTPELIALIRKEEKVNLVKYKERKAKEK